MLNAALELRKELIIPVMEELRLQGLTLTIESFSSIIRFLSEQYKFMEEAELRSYLALEFIRGVYTDPTSYIDHKVGIRTGPHLHSNFVLAMYCHLEGSGIEFSAEKKHPIDLIEWFMGKIPRSKRICFSFPGYFPNIEVRENYFKSKENQCREVFGNPSKKWLLKSFMSFVFLIEKKPEAEASLISIMNQCREFTPGGAKGNDALKLTCLVYNILQESKKETLDYLIEKLPVHLTEVLTYSLNKQSEGNFMVPTFKNFSATVQRTVTVIGSMHNTGYAVNWMLQKDRLSTLITFFDRVDVPFTVKWINCRPEGWIDDRVSDRHNWWSVFSARSDLRDKLLDWAEKLHTRGLDWLLISNRIYWLNYRFSRLKIDRCIENFHSVEWLHGLSEKLCNILDKEKNFDFFYQLLDVYLFFDRLLHGWRDAEDYFREFETYCIELAQKTEDKEDFDVSQDSDRIKWISLISDTPEQFKRFLNITPQDYVAEYDVTLLTVSRLKVKAADVYCFLQDFMTDAPSVKRVFSLLKGIKNCIRLSYKEFFEAIENWSQKSEKSSLKSLEFYRKLAGHKESYPRNFRKWMNLTEKYSTEFDCLSERQLNGELSESGFVRYFKLKELLENPGKIRLIEDKELSRQLPDALKYARIEALEKITMNICFEHWRRVSGYTVEQWNEDWTNALQLSFTCSHNKRILKKVMRNAAGNDFQWIYCHPVNQRFLSSAGGNLKTEEWLKPKTKSYEIQGSQYNLEVETNLLKILHMGNYFGSCLSVGDFNDFSTIANAVEINKHVIWVKNKKGCVIGRKLIVIDKGLKLYGFHSYGSGGCNRKNMWIKIILDLYCLELAQKAGLKLTNERDYDNPLNLFAKWYDDGIEDYEEWIIDIQKGASLSDIEKKSKYKEEHLSSALWLNKEGYEVDKRWFNCKSFINAMEIKQV